jgi:serine/threonine-protein kinase
VLDFGLAKLIECVESEESRAAPRALVQTASDAVMGTVAYMSPEQARGQAVDARTDLWSLGVMLYELVAGRRPFAGETDGDLIANILRTEPEPLSAVAPEAPAELVRIVGRALRKPLGERYQTAAELHAALSALGDVSAQAVKRDGRPPVGAREETLSTSLLVAQQRMGEANNLPQQLTGGDQLQASAQPSPSIAVLAFVNMSADPENEYFCDGLATELTNALAKIKALRVAARTSAFYFKGKNTDVHEIGQTLNVGVVLEGIVRKAGNRLRITVQLVNVADGYHLWSERYDREMEDVFDLQDEISLAIVDVLKVKLLGAEKAAVMKRYTDNTEAYQLYLKGRFFWYRFPGPGYDKAREYFQQSIDSDPTYALGFCGLADYFGMAAALGLMPPDEGWLKCAAVMEKALALDDTLADVYNTKAGISFYCDRDWPAAERAFKHAIELNPNFAEVHHHYGLCLVSYGRTEEALAGIRRGLQLDPLSLHRNLWQGRVFYWLGWYEKAIEQYFRTLDLDGNFALAHKWLGAAYEQTGQHVEAIGEWSRALVLQGSGDLAALVDDTFAAAGFEAAVRTLALRRLERLNERKQRGDYVPAMAFVTLYLRLGDREQTTAWLAKAVRERNRPVLEISVDPRYECLRRDPNWAGLARTMGFPDLVQRSA